MSETLQIISLCIGIVLNVLTLTALGSNKVREKLFKSKEQKRKEAEEADNHIMTQQCLLRDAILTNYNRHKAAKEWTVDDYENFEHLYRQYEKLKGNSFVKKLWNEVQNWKTIM